MLRNDTPIPFGDAQLQLSKWLPEAPKPPPGVLVFFGTDGACDYEATARELVERGFIVALIRPDAADAVGSMKAQYDFLKNQYLAIPFFAASVGDQIPFAAEYAAQHPKDFFGMVWIDPNFDAKPLYLDSEQKEVGLFERIFRVFDEKDETEHVIDSVRSLPRIPLAVFTDDLKESAALLQDISHEREITLLVFPPNDDPAYRMKALVRQLKGWHLDRVDALVETKRGALRWDREKQERE